MKITETGFGKFKATNGYDVITAEFERGKKGADGKFHPHWNLTSGSETKVIYAGKSEVLEYTSKRLLTPQEKPLTEDEARAIQEKDFRVHGIVKMSMSELIDNDLDGVLNLMNERLCSEVLSDMRYFVVDVGNDGETLHIRVEGSLDF